MALTQLADNDVQAERLTDVLRLPKDLKKRTRIRVASYNVYNLFGEDAEHPKPTEQLAALADVILALDADVISFAEVGSLATLKELFQSRINPKLEGADKYDAYICIPANDRRGINVALATRLSVRGKMSFSDREFEKNGKTIKFSRDLLGVLIQATPDPEHTFMYFVGHLKSKIGGDDAEQKRRAEAGEVIDIFTGPTFGAAFITQPLLFAGDFNADPDTKPIDILKKGTLTDLFEDVQPNYTYPTALSKGHYDQTRLDYMFASPSMKDRMQKLDIYRKDPTDEASDHYPISAEMRLV